MRRVLCVLPIAACSVGEPEPAPTCAVSIYDADGAPDTATPAEPDDSCVGTEAPTLDCGIEVCGTVHRIVNPDETLAFATIEAFDRDEQLIASTVGNADGTYCLQLPELDGGFDGRLSAAVRDRRTHDAIFAARPMTASTDALDAGLEQEDFIRGLLPAFDLPEADPDKGIVDPVFTDCAGQWVEGVSIAIDAAYDGFAYIGEGYRLDVSLTATVAGVPSAALFVNVEPGPFTVTVTEAATGAVLTTCAGYARAGHWTAVLCQMR